MWDLAPHDISMIAYVTGKKPARVISATGCSSDRNEIMDITHIDVEFEGGMVGHISDANVTDNSTPYTPAVNLIVALKKALEMMKEEGLDNVYARHALIAKALRNAKTASEDAIAQAQAYAQSLIEQANK